MALITYLTRIQFEFGAVRLLKDELPPLGVRRPLIVTDPGVVKAGIVQRVLDSLPDGTEGVVWDGTPENPTEEAMDAALAVWRARGCDGAIGVGGGSSMDLAKAIALMATHLGALKDYMAILGGGPRITAKIAPVVAIPTTAGTGSEVGRGAVMILKDGRKLALLSPHMLPKLAICDPELTLGLPAKLTAGTGMDAFAHCVETFLAPAVNPPAEAIALDGFGHVVNWIEKAVANGGDREARWHMMMGAMEGAMAFQKGLGAVHGMSHPLGSLKALKLHHGTLNAICLPPVLRYNAGHVGDKMDRLAKAWGLPQGADVADEVEKLNARLGIPKHLGALGVTWDMVEPLIPQAVADHTTATNPRPLTGQDYQVLFREALG